MEPLGAQNAWEETRDINVIRRLINIGGVGRNEGREEGTRVLTF